MRLFQSWTTRTHWQYIPPAPDFVEKCSFGGFCSPVTPVKYVPETQRTSWEVLRKPLEAFLSNLNSDYVVFQKGLGKDALMTTLTGKQDHLGEANKTYTGNHQGKENIFANAKFIFFLLLYVFLA